MFCLYFLFLQVQSKRLYLFKNLSISLGCPLYCHVISYDPLYFCGTSCNFSFVISNFTDLLLEYSLTSYRKIKSKYIRDLNVRQGSIKLLEENIGRNLCEFELVNGFLDKTPKIQTTKEKINLTLSNLEIFMLQRIIIKKMKTQSIEWEKSICKSYI